MKKFIKLLTIVTILISCNSDNINIEGEFVNVISKNNEFNVYTFNFNKTIKINKNGENYLVTDASEKKSIGTYENGIIKLQNDCSILIDQSENVLTKTCQNSSSDYWNVKKARNYSSTINKKVNFYNYLNEVFDKQDLIMEFGWIGEYEFDKNRNELLNHYKNISNKSAKNNIYYPYLCTGDFNQDNKYPDIAFIAGESEAGIVENYSIMVLFAGKKRPIVIDNLGNNYNKWSVENHFKGVIKRIDLTDVDYNHIIYYKWNGKKFQKYNYDPYGAG